MKISVIMASYLDGYEGCAGQRREKFRRAVDSFIAQTYADKELIIVSDGCDITNQIYEKKYAKEFGGFIKLIELPKHTKHDLFSGAVRQAGIEIATGKLICYLDTDDYFGENHLTQISQFDVDQYSWCYFDDYVRYNHIAHIAPERRGSLIEGGRIGTSNIAHKNKPLDFNWIDCDGYGHDYLFVTSKLLKHENYLKIGGGQYYVCHVPGSVDV